MILFGGDCNSVDMILFAFNLLLLVWFVVFVVLLFELLLVLMFGCLLWWYVCLNGFVSY